MMDGSVAWRPLTLALSPCTGRGNDLDTTANLTRRCEGRTRLHPLLPVKARRRWPTGRMRGRAMAGGAS